jgi:SAM-dependent methyltransferase
MKRVYNAWRKRLVVSERKAFRRLLAPVDREAPVLEVGCGQGGKLEWLRSLGFTDLTGVDVDRRSAAAARERGFTAMTPAELESFQPERRFSLLVAAHVIEHLPPLELVEFLDRWLERLAPGGLVLLASPVLHSGFYLDFDHVRPYYPQGIMDFFGPGAAQTQRRSRHVLELEDVRFKRGPWRIRMARPLLFKQGDAWLHVLNLLLLFAFAGTGEAAGRMEGWVGLFRAKGQREDDQ